MPKCCVIKCAEVGVHCFPRDNKMQKSWLKAIRRPNLSPKDSKRLCRNHFLDTDYLGSSLDTGFEHSHRYLKKTAVPSQFSWNCKVSAASTARAERAVRNSKICLNFMEPPIELTIQNKTSLVHDEQFAVGREVDVYGEIPCHPLETTCNISLQKSTQTSCMSYLFSTESLLTDDISVRFYTGLDNFKKFQLVLNTLLPMANNLKYRWSQDCSLSVEDQFLLLLIKLRRNKTDFELSKLFNISKTSVSNILVTWINFVNDMWRLMDIWPSRELIN